MDHSPGGAAIKEATGAQISGGPRRRDQDASFAPDRVLAHGKRVRLGGSRCARSTRPGHASNHLCYLLEETTCCSPATT